MKTKIQLEKGESLSVEEEKLEKALKAKKECSPGEQYCDPAVNEFHDLIAERHEKLVKSVVTSISIELERHLNSRGY